MLRKALGFELCMTFHYSIVCILSHNVPVLLRSELTWSFIEFHEVSFGCTLRSLVQLPCLRRQSRVKRYISHCTI